MPCAGPTDGELLAAHVRGDRDAFGQLVRRHRDRLWAVALRTLGNPDDAEDALQDAFVAAYRRAATFRGDAAVTTWLHRIVVNACLDRARAARVRRVVPLDAVTEPVEPRNAVEQRELALDLEAALATLRVEERVAIVLVDVEGRPIDEVAAILGVPSGTVKSRCARGRARLAAVLRAAGNEPGAGDVGVDERRAP